MRFAITVMFFGLVMAGMAQRPYVERLKYERDSINAHFSDTSASILPAKDLEHFNGLPFYPIDTNFRVSAKFRKRKGKPFEMATSTSRLPVYRKYGVLKFEVEGVSCKLFLYQRVREDSKDTAYADYLFCPFRDLSNSDSTYGGGRYLDFRISELKSNVIVDFNTCYNPYCAYNSRYSCPVPPRENHIDVRIDAGVKRWHD